VALSATVFKVELGVSDVDHGYYADHTLTVARHPSETDERMVVRLLAFGLRAHRLSDIDGELVFGAGLTVLVVEQENAEPLLVTRARHFIAANKAETLSLAAVAKAAGASVFHFCKVFRKSTGLKFTEYVSRVRLEDAKGRLLNPNLRISEIAYDVGFQSLTQFNRTFKRTFGQSPTEFRTAC